MFGHMPVNDYEEGDIRNQWTELFNNMDIQCQFAGHKHDCTVYEPNTVRNYPILICGGRQDDLGYKFEAMHITLKDNKIFGKAYNQKGESIFDKEIS